MIIVIVTGASQKGEERGKRSEGVRGQDLGLALAGGPLMGPGQAQGLPLRTRRVKSPLSMTTRAACRSSCRRCMGSRRRRCCPRRSRSSWKTATLLRREAILDAFADAKRRAGRLSRLLGLPLGRGGHRCFRGDNRFSMQSFLLVRLHKPDGLYAGEQCCRGRGRSDAAGFVRD